MFDWYSIDGMLLTFAIVGVTYVSYCVFTDEKAAHRDRREEGFDLFDRD